VLAEGAAAAVAAEDLITAWTTGKTLLSTLIGSVCQPDALAAGWAVARALGGPEGATVEAEQVPVC
jgi:hypothetical protein